eukprot:1874461-Pyramimonas_sp.AAC.2
MDGRAGRMSPVALHQHFTSKTSSSYSSLTFLVFIIIPPSNRHISCHAASLSASGNHLLPRGAVTRGQLTSEPTGLV